MYINLWLFFLGGGVALEFLFSLFTKTTLWLLSIVSGIMAFAEKQQQKQQLLIYMILFCTLAYGYGIGTSPKKFPFAYFDFRFDSHVKL